jgi:hypothetical protein
MLYCSATVEWMLNFNSSMQKMDDSPLGKPDPTLLYAFVTNSTLPLSLFLLLVVEAGAQT